MGEPTRAKIIYAMVPMVMVLIGAYFAFAAVQGDRGLFQRIQINAERDALASELGLLQAEVTRMEGLTRRLSDQFLEHDLLDEQARRVLGQLRSDEIIVER